MSSSTEDAMCIRQIKMQKRHAEELFHNEGEVIVETEKHYNHYGNRGVADLFCRRVWDSGVESDHVYEFKSDAAIEGSTGANEIIRQFNKMCKFFYKDDEIDLPKTTAWSFADVTFELCFNPTPLALEHVIDNLEIYQTVIEPQIPTGLRDAKSIVTFRSADSDSPSFIATSGEWEGSREDVERMFKREFEGEDADV